MKKEKIIDFTTDEWKKDYLIGRKIITRPWKKHILMISVIIFLIAIITPFTNIFLIPLSFWILKKWG